MPPSPAPRTSIELRLVINRVTANTMEPRGVIGDYDAATSRYTLAYRLPAAAGVRADLAEPMFKIPGGRSFADHRRYRRLLRHEGRPSIPEISWCSGRRAERRPAGEMDRRAQRRHPQRRRTPATTSSMPTLALDKDGKFLALRVDQASAISAPICRPARAMPPIGHRSAGRRHLYASPALHVRFSGMLTNTHAIGALSRRRPARGVLHDRAADRHRRARDEHRPAELRRRNTIPPSAMPYKTPLAFTYDSGEFEENMDRALKLGDWHGFESAAPRPSSAASCAASASPTPSSRPRDPTIETAEIRFDPLGSMTFVTGSISHGQGHDTMQTQMLVGPARRRSATVSSSSRATPTRSPSAWAPAARARPRMSGGAIVMVERQDHRQGQEARRAYAGGRRGRHRVQGRPLHHRRHRPRIGDPRGRARPRSSRPGCRTAWSPASTRPRPIAPAAATSPTAATSARSRSIPTPARSQIVGYCVVDDVGTVINPCW